MKVHSDLIHRFAWGTDGSFYRKTPRLVVRADNEEDVIQILKKVRRDGTILDRRSLLSVKDPYLERHEGDITAVLTEDPVEYAGYWAIRSGIFPTVGGLREKGTTCLIEDVAFHLEDLPQATEDLSALLGKHGYKDSCIYGHALAGILNPGVIFNDDPLCYIMDFKALTPLGHENIDKCIECGFSLSSRTRIAVQREIARLRADGSDPDALAALEKGYRYLGDETCAADLTHELREASASSHARSVGKMAAKHFHAGKNALRGILAMADVGHLILGSKAMSAVGRGLHKGAGLPLWTPAMPKAYRVPSIKQEEHPDKVVYFPSCLNQMMGLERKSPARRPLVEETVARQQKAGFEVIFPEKMDSLCCGMIWESKGQKETAEQKSRELEAALRKASCDGRNPILCDQSPCLHRMQQNIPNLHPYGPVGFIKAFLPERLDFHQSTTPVVLHPTCSTRLMGLDKDLVEIARLCSSDVRVPEDILCCGFAGDKGMTHPELNDWSLRKLRSQVEGVPAGYSNSRTCEIGLENHAGIPYMSIIYQVNQCTTACG